MRETLKPNGMRAERLRSREHVDGGETIVAEIWIALYQLGVFSDFLIYFLVKLLLAPNYMKDMTEVIIDTDKRSKRRLPTWMQSNDTFKNENLLSLDELCSTSGKQTETQGAVSIIESMSSETDVVLSEKKKNSENKEIFAKNYSKKNTRKPKKRDGSKDSTCNSGGTKRRFEGEVDERGKCIDALHMKLKSAKSNSVKVLFEGMTEDEAELTVEDLISIAEEFLTSDKEMQNEQSVARKCESDSIPISSSESSISRRGKLNREIRSCQGLSKCTQTRSSHLNKLGQKQKEESATLSANKITQSGDVAQDMLELFLGPLLKKAPLKEPDPEITRELLNPTYESDSLVRGFVDVEKQAPLMKKKSSLKDKVAMFFD